MRRKILFAATAAALSFTAFAAPADAGNNNAAPLWLRDVKISPNGDLIAFT